MEISNIYICATLHHVMIAMIKQVHSSNHSDIVLCTDIPDAKTLVPRLMDSGLFENVYYFDKYKCADVLSKNYIKNLFFLHSKHIKAIESVWKIDLNRYQNIYIFNDAVELGKYLFDKRIRYHLIEDGINGFQVIDKYIPHFDRIAAHPSLLRRFFWIFHYGYRPWGQSKWCIDIEVNEKKDLKIPDRKIIVKPKTELYASLSEKEKRLIYHTFVREAIPDITSGIKTLLLLTQPLAEDKLVESMQIQEQVYRDIVDQYGEDYHLVIKPHPRDQMDYAEIFPDAIIMDKRIPMEIINFNDAVNFDKAITIESSSIQSLQCVREKVKLGIEILDDYQKNL